MERATMITSWHSKWLVGAMIVPIGFYLSRSSYFDCSIAFPFLEAPASGCASIYDSMYKAQGVYFGSLLATYLGLYVLVSLNAKKISKREAAIHLIAWTLAPPLWFSFERYFFFQGTAQEAKLLDCDPKLKEREQRIKALKEGQDYASKLWGAILAVLLAFKLGEIVKESPATASDESIESALKRTETSSDESAA